MKYLSILMIGFLSACSQSTPEFKRAIQITTNSLPVQCVAREGDMSVALMSTPGTMIMPYGMEHPTVECIGRGLHGRTVANVPSWKLAQTIYVPMSMGR